MLKAFPAVKEREDMRKIIGRYGLTGRQQVRFQLFSVITSRLMQSPPRSRFAQFVSCLTDKDVAWCLPI